MRPRLGPEPVSGGLARRQTIGPAKTKTVSEVCEAILVLRVSRIVVAVTQPCNEQAQGLLRHDCVQATPQVSKMCAVGS